MPAGNWRTWENPLRYRKNVQSPHTRVRSSFKPKTFFYRCKRQLLSVCRRYRCGTDKRLSTPVNIRCIKEPSRTKARGSNQNVHHRKTVQGQTPVRMAICLKIPVDGRWTVWGPPALHGLTVRLRKCDRCIFKMLFFSRCRLNFRLSATF